MTVLAQTCAALSPRVPASTRNSTPSPIAAGTVILASWPAPTTPTPGEPAWLRSRGLISSLTVVAYEVTPVAASVPARRRAPSVYPTDGTASGLQDPRRAIDGVATGAHKGNRCATREARQARSPPGGPSRR